MQQISSVVGGTGGGCHTHCGITRKESGQGICWMGDIGLKSMVARCPPGTNASIMLE